MITESYSEERESLFSPGAFFGERKYICDTAIITFSGEIFQAVIDRYPHREVAYIGSANGHKAIYAVDINGMEIVFYLSSIGACLAGTEIIEMEWQTGVKSLIIFGSCGALDSEATKGKYIVPTQAYRDEGMSYHYAPPSDYMDIKNADRLARILEQLRRLSKDVSGQRTRRTAKQKQPLRKEKATAASRWKWSLRVCRQFVIFTGSSCTAS